MKDNKNTKKKYKINVAVFATRLTIIVMVIATGTTAYKYLSNKSSNVTYAEQSAYIDIEGNSSMVKGVTNGAVYPKQVTPVLVISNAKKITLTRDGKKIAFKSGRKINKQGSYILSIEDTNGNIDTVYFDIEY